MVRQESWAPSMTNFGGFSSGSFLKESGTCSSTKGSSDTALSHISEVLNVSGTCSSTQGSCETASLYVHLLRLEFIWHVLKQCCIHVYFYFNQIFLQWTELIPNFSTYSSLFRTLTPAKFFTPFLMTSKNLENFLMTSSKITQLVLAKFSPCLDLMHS